MIQSFDIIIIGSGQESPQTLARLGSAQQPPCIICADGGANFATQATIVPHHVVGDMDSVAPGVLAELEARGATIHRHPSAKDSSDLELALELALSLGKQSIALTCVLGHRPDHLLSNLTLLLSEHFRSANVCIIEDSLSACALLSGTRLFRGKKGDLFSVIPCSPVVQGCSIEGARWSLMNEQLALGSTRSISNVFECEELRITIEEGDAIFVHFRNESASIS